jgi:mycothiol S-conjugate amidase
MAAAGMRSFWLPPEDATPEQIAEHEAFLEQTLTPDEAVTTRIDVNDFLDAKLAATSRHVTQISLDHPFMRFGVEGWREFGGFEAFVLRESRVPTEIPETDLFAGL